MHILIALQRGADHRVRPGVWLGAVLAALLCLAGSAQAQEAPAAALPEAPFLWQLEVGGVTHYLQGTLHALPVRYRPLPPGLVAAQARVKVVAVESILGASTALDAPQTIASVTGNDPLGLRARVGDPLYGRFAAALKAQRLNVASFERLRPWAAAGILAAFSNVDAGLSTQNGIDYQVFIKSRRDKTVVGLETDQVHRDLENRMPDQVSLELFQQTLLEAEAGATGPSQLADLWRRGDEAGMAAYATRLKAERPAFYRYYIGDRNRAWLPALKAMLRSGKPHLVLAGALHWTGPEGLQALLAKENMKPQPFSPDAPPSSP